MIVALKRYSAHLAAVAVLAGGLGTAGGARAEPLRMAPDAQKAMRQFDEAAEKLGRARAAMAALEAEERPKGSAADWAGAPAAIDAAAEALRRAEGPTLPDPEEYGVPQEQLRSCASRPAALSRLERQVRSLQAAAQRCGETRAYLRERLASSQAAEEARRALVKGAARLAGEPELAQLYPWRWADVDKGLGGAIAVYAAELRKQQDRVERGQGELRAKATALSGLASDYGKAQDCVLAGLWVGIRSLSGTVSALSMQLTASGGGWTGSASLDGAEVPVRAVTLRGSTVDVVLRDRQATLHGTLGGDGRTLKGTLTSADGQATFTLRKQ